MFPRIYLCKRNFFLDVNDNNKTFRMRRRIIRRIRLGKACRCRFAGGCVRSNDTRYSYNSRIEFSRTEVAMVAYGLTDAIYIYRMHSSSGIDVNDQTTANCGACAHLWLRADPNTGNLHRRFVASACSAFANRAYHTTNVDDDPWHRDRSTFVLVMRVRESLRSGFPRNKSIRIRTSFPCSRSLTHVKRIQQARPIRT